MTVHWFVEPHEVTSRIDRLNGLLDLSVELPESPFPRDGYVDLCAFDIIYEDLFPMMVSAVAEHHGDDHVDFVTTLPDAVGYFLPTYSFSASFAEPVPLSPASFAEAVWFNPGDDPTGSIAIATNNFVISGDSRSWVVYGYSRWDAIFVWSTSRSRPWLAQGNTFLSPAELFEAYVVPGEPGARWSDAGRGTVRVGHSVVARERVLTMTDLRALVINQTHAVAEHLREFFGAENAITWESPLVEGPLRSRAPFFSVFEVSPTGDFPYWTYVSAGSLNHAMVADDHNVEFVIASATQDPRMVQHLAENSYYHCGPCSQRLDLGHRLPVGAPWVPGATVDATLVSLPYPYGEDLEYVQWDGRHTRVLWLMPITTSELDFARREGNERLEQLFETNHVEFTDLSRPSVV